MSNLNSVAQCVKFENQKIKYMYFLMINTKVNRHYNRFTERNLYKYVFDIT